MTTLTLPKPPVSLIDLGGVNQWRGTRQKPRAVVLHIAQGSLAGCDTWFANPQAKASANFIVGLSGAIHQYIDPDGPNSPYANGSLNGADAAVLALYEQAGRTNPNDWTVSIEHEGYSGVPLAAAQLKASAALCAWACDRYAIPPDEDHILGHYEFDKVTRSGCPGFSRQGWLDYEQALDDALGGAQLSLEDRIVADIRREFETARVGLRASVGDHFHQGDPGEGSQQDG